MRALRASVLIEPTSTIKNVTTIDYYRNRTNGDSNVLTDVRTPSAFVDALTNSRPSVLAALARQRSRGVRVVENDADPYGFSVRWGITNRTDIEISDAFTITNILGYRRNKVNYNINTDGLGRVESSGPPNAFGLQPGAQFSMLNGGARVQVEQFTEELQLKGSLYDGRVNWLLGGFYLKSEPWGPMGTGSKTASTLPSSVNFNTFGYNYLTDESKAVFGNLGMQIAEGLKLTLGARYTWDKVEACTASEVYSAANPDLGRIGPEACYGQQAPLTGTAVSKGSSSAPTYQVSLEYQATRDIFAYLTTRRGYRSGSLNAPTFAGRLAKYQAYDPETVNDIEAGVRTDWSISNDVRVRFNASAFIGWYKNVITSLSQVTTSVGACLATGPDTVVNPTTGRLASPDGDCNPNNDPISGAMSINAGKTRVRGIDIDGFIAVGPSFKFTYAANWMDPESRSVTIPTELRPYVSSTVIGFDFVAKSTFSLGAAYNTQLGSIGDLGASIDLYHSSPASFTDIKFPSYNVVNARVDLNNVGGMPIDLSVYARNLFDEEYIQAGAFNGPNAGVGASIFGAPAQYGVSIRYRFGT